MCKAVAAVLMATLSGERHVKAKFYQKCIYSGHYMFNHMRFIVPCTHYQVAYVAGWWLDDIQTPMSKSIRIEMS